MCITSPPQLWPLIHLRLRSRQGSERGSLSERLKDGVSLGNWYNAQGYLLHALLGNEI